MEGAPVSRAVGWKELQGAGLWGGGSSSEQGCGVEGAAFLPTALTKQRGGEKVSLQLVLPGHRPSQMKVRAGT